MKIKVVNEELNFLMHKDSDIPGCFFFAPIVPLPVECDGIPFYMKIHLYQMPEVTLTFCSNHWQLLQTGKWVFQMPDYLPKPQIEEIRFKVGDNGPSWTLPINRK